MNFSARWFVILGALNAAVAVGLGAAGSHALQAILAANDPANRFALALQYHQFHALGLILLGYAADRIPVSRWLIGAGGLMLAGIVLFCGGLYLLSLFGLRAFHAAIPFGGASFIVAWLLFAFGVLRHSPDRVRSAEVAGKKIDQGAHLR